MSTLNFEKLESLLSTSISTIARDLRLNLKRLLEEGALEPQEKLLTLLAVSKAVDHAGLVEFAETELQAQGLPAEQILEAKESAAIMGMLNIYYRFKHMVGKDEDYRSAGLRMTALARPQLGKERFEMLALAVSAINGCETCISSHEKVLRDAGVSVEKIHDLARFAAVVKGLKSL